MNQTATYSAPKLAASSRRRFSIGRLLIYAILGVLFVTQLYPLLWLVIYSLKTNEEILSGSFFSLPASWQWVNYQNALTGGAYWKYLSNSVIVTSITIVSVIVLAALVAFAIARFRWKYGQFVLVLFLVGMMIPLQSTLLPLMIMFKQVDLLNTRWSIILPYIAFQTPIAVFILSSFFQTIPNEIEESAIVDGASVMRIFGSIMLPLSVPPIMTVCILTFINIWNEYVLASTFIGAERLKTLPFGVYSFVSQYSVNYGAIGAFLVLGALPVVIIYFLLAEKITKGMVAGAVKG
jgi:raffinose/stachyose/melibiose transport system permease protein